MFIKWSGRCHWPQCPSIFSSLAIELNVPRDESSSLAIELTFVTLRRDFKKPVQFSLYQGLLSDKDFVIRLYQ